MTQEKFILSNLTRWDKIKTNLFYTPILLFCYGIIEGMYKTFYLGDGTANPKLFFLVFVLAIPSVYFNIQGNRKIQRLRDEYDELNRLI